MFYSEKLLFRYKIIIIVLWIFSLYLTRFIPLEMSQNTQYSAMHFNSQDQSDSTLKEFTASIAAAEKKSATFHFRMKVHEIQHWDNIFQTAERNRGIRMEFEAPSSLHLIIGDGTPDGFIGVPIIKNLEFMRWYAVTVGIKHDNTIRAFVDGEKICEITDRPVAFEMNDIAIGAGYSKTRRFHGELKDFSLTVKTYKASKLRFYIRYVLIVVLAIFIALFLNQKQDLVRIYREIKKFIEEL